MSPLIPPLSPKKFRELQEWKDKKEGKEIIRKVLKYLFS